jgi:hypothetical protein
MAETNEGYAVSSLGELRDARGWSPIRRKLGVRSFGVNAWRSDAGDRLIPDHDEVPSGHEELYVILAGEARFTIGQEEDVPAPAGSVVLVRDPALRRGAEALTDGTVVLAVGARPGDAYQPRAWEMNSDLLPLWEQEAYEDARDLLLSERDRYEDPETLLYNLACAEAQLGDGESALRHLEEAVGRRPDLVGLAREDSDFDDIKDDPRFDALVGGAATNGGDDHG